MPGIGYVPPPGSGGGSGDMLSTNNLSDVASVSTSRSNLGAAPLASPTFTGTPVLPTGTTATTQSAADGSTKLATTAYVDTADALKANLASPTFTGTPTLPTGTIATTQSASDSSTKVATTAMVQAALTALTGAVGGLPRVIRRTSNGSTVTNTTSLVSDDTLILAVGASDVWFFEFFLSLTMADNGGAATTADVKIGFSLSGSIPTTALNWGLLNSTSQGGFVAVGTGSSPNALPTGASNPTFGGAAVTFGQGGMGWYHGDGTHSGNITLGIAQATANAATVQINTDSFIRAVRHA